MSHRAGSNETSIFGDSDLLRMSAIFCAVATVVFAFANGYQLIGFGFGILMGLVAAGALWTVYRSFKIQSRFSFLNRAVAIGFALTVIYMIAFPASWTPNWFAEDVAERRLELNYQPRIEALLSKEKRFDSIDVEMVESKGFRVLVVQGTVKNDQDLFDLQRLILDRYPELDDLTFSFDLQIAGN